MNPLQNSIHEKFAQTVANGRSVRDAYLHCYPNTSSSSASASGRRLAKRNEVAQRISYLQNQNAEISMWSREEAMDILKNIAHDESKKDRDRIAAVDLLNSMNGFNSSPQQEITVQNNVFSFLSPDGVRNDE